jgi:hypothetical protein
MGGAVLNPPYIFPIWESKANLIIGGGGSGCGGPTTLVGNLRATPRFRDGWVGGEPSFGGEIDGWDGWLCIAFLFSAVWPTSPHTDGENGTTH